MPIKKEDTCLDYFSSFRAKKTGPSRLWINTDIDRSFGNFLTILLKGLTSSILTLSKRRRTSPLRIPDSCAGPGVICSTNTPWS